jgi:hypothetical protein
MYNAITAFYLNAIISGSMASYIPSNEARSLNARRCCASSSSRFLFNLNNSSSLSLFPSDPKSPTIKKSMITTNNTQTKTENTTTRIDINKVKIGR